MVRGSDSAARDALAAVSRGPSRTGGKGNGNGTDPRTGTIGSRARDFAAAFWPDFAAYGPAAAQDGHAARRRVRRRGVARRVPDGAARDVGGRRRRGAVAAAAEAAARELELQRAQLVAIASRLAKAAGVPSAPRLGRVYPRAADARRSPPGRSERGGAGTRRRGGRRRRRARAAEPRDTARARVRQQVEEGQRRSGRIRRGTSSGSLASAMADLAEVARDARAHGGDRRRGDSAHGGGDGGGGRRRRRRRAAGGSPAVVAAALAEMAAALRRGRAAAGVDGGGARRAARAGPARPDRRRARGRGAGATPSLAGSSTSRVARDRVGATTTSGWSRTPVRRGDVHLNGILRKPTRRRGATRSGGGGGGDRGSLSARRKAARLRGVSKRPARRRQLGDRVPPDPRRPSSLEFKARRGSVRGARQRPTKNRRSNARRTKSSARLRFP